jgi:hypothetical protein
MLLTKLSLTLIRRGLSTQDVAESKVGLPKMWPRSEVTELTSLIKGNLKGEII